MSPMPGSLYTLLAQTGTNPGVLVPREKLQEISRLHNEGFRHDIPWQLLLVGLGTTIICIAAISLRRWWLARQDDPSPLVLYSAIARRAGLTWSDRLVLWRMARKYDLPTPIALLLARGTLRHYARQYAANRTATGRDKLVQRFARIEAELFG